MSAVNIQRRTVRYRGHVQGVGFRYTVVHLAQKHLVVGFVRNLPNGEVELIVEGGESDLDAFLAAVATLRQENIAETTTAVGQPSGEFDGFNIR